MYVPLSPIAFEYNVNIYNITLRCQVVSGPWRCFHPGFLKFPRSIFVATNARYVILIKFLHISTHGCGRGCRCVVFARYKPSAKMESLFHFCNIFRVGHFFPGKNIVGKKRRIVYLASNELI